MELTPTTLSVILVCASLAVVGLLIHYISRVGRGRDMLCSFGLAAQFGLLGSGLGYRSAAAPLEPTINSPAYVSPCPCASSPLLSGGKDCAAFVRRADGTHPRCRAAIQSLILRSSTGMGSAPVISTWAWKSRRSKRRPSARSASARRRNMVSWPIL